MIAQTAENMLDGASLRRYSSNGLTLQGLGTLGDPPAENRDRSPGSLGFPSRTETFRLAGKGPIPAPIPGEDMKTLCPPNLVSWVYQEIKRSFGKTNTRSVLFSRRF